ncbi:MAG: hypothetical protein EXS17_03260 [Phycisphaerales bacterium]|nr:hypothetical protein [Phycisphaerales bacterium]
MRQICTTVICSMIAGVVGAIATLSLSGSPANATRIWPSDLGPADALILTGKDAALTVTNQSGRMAWSDSPSARAYSVGCVHTDRVMKGILSSERFTVERQKFDDEARSQGEEFEQRSKTLQDRYPAVKPGDSTFEQAKQEFALLQGEYEKWFATLQKIQSKHMAEQVEMAYRELTAALDVVAERKQVDFVYRFIPPERAFDSVELSDAMMQVQLRQFLRYPAAVDLTEDLVKEIGITSQP